jgi:predicted outer membrane lipoprotein
MKRQKMKIDFFVDLLVKCFPFCLPYIAALYYIDIIFLLPRAIFILGKPLAAFGIIVFTALWTKHAISLYYRNETNRKIHLAVITIDFALRLPFAVNFIIFFKNQSPWYEAIFFALNLITLITAVLSIYMLTDSRVKSAYS